MKSWSPGGDGIKTFTLRLDDELHKQLKYLSVELEMSINEYIVELIKKDLENREK